MIHSAEHQLRILCSTVKLHFSDHRSNAYTVLLQELSVLLEGHLTLLAFTKQRGRRDDHLIDVALLDLICKDHSDAAVEAAGTAVFTLTRTDLILAASGAGIGLTVTAVSIRGLAVVGPAVWCSIGALGVQAFVVGAAGFGRHANYDNLQ